METSTVSVHQCGKFKNTINNILAFYSVCYQVTKFVCEDGASKDGTPKKEQEHAWGVHCHLWKGFSPLSGHKFNKAGKTDSRRRFIGNRERARCIKEQIQGERIAPGSAAGVLLLQRRGFLVLLG